MDKDDKPPVVALAYSRKHAAAALDIGVDHFDAHVRPQLKETHIGGATRYRVTELQRYLDESSSKT
jgi:hypothetical protein